jgi:hypothetical protein
MFSNGLPPLPLPHGFSKKKVAFLLEIPPYPSTLSITPRQSFTTIVSYALKFCICRPSPQKPKNRAIQPFTFRNSAGQQKTSYNVIATLKPNVANSTDEIVYVSDSVPGAPGANDDASGTAATIVGASLHKIADPATPSFDNYLDFFTPVKYHYENRLP